MGTRAQMERKRPLMQMALAEAGYPDASLDLIEAACGDWGLKTKAALVPGEIFYRASVLAAQAIGISHACWKCWSRSQGWDLGAVKECREGRCPHG